MDQLPGWVKIEPFGKQCFRVSRPPECKGMAAPAMLHWERPYLMERQPSECHSRLSINRRERDRGLCDNDQCYWKTRSNVRDRATPTFVCPATSYGGKCPSAGRRRRKCFMEDDDDDGYEEDCDDNSSDEYQIPEFVLRMLDTVSEVKKKKKKESCLRRSDAAREAKSKGNKIPAKRCSKRTEETKHLKVNKGPSSSLLPSLQSCKWWLDIGAEFMQDPEDELQRIVEKAARSQVARHFEGAVKAAEAAADEAPPEEREEAAIEAARKYQASMLESEVAKAVDRIPRKGLRQRRPRKPRKKDYFCTC